MSAAKTSPSVIGQVRDVFPKLGELTDKVVFGDVWERKGLSKRDRSLRHRHRADHAGRARAAPRPSLARARQRRDASEEIIELDHPPRVLRRLAERRQRRADGRSRCSQSAGHEDRLHRPRRAWARHMAAQPRAAQGTPCSRSTCSGEGQRKSAARSACGGAEVLFTSLPGPAEVDRRRKGGLRAESGSTFQPTRRSAFDALHNVAEPGCGAASRCSGPAAP